jgi:hypothetical protein
LYSSLLAPITQDSSYSQHWPEPHLLAVEFAELGIAKEDAVHFIIHLFQPDLIVSEYFADEYLALMPTDVSTVVHSVESGTP